MDTRSYQCGQLETGEVSHNGHWYSSGGSSVCGRNLTAYVKELKTGSHSGGLLISVALTRWSGAVLLEVESARCKCGSEYFCDPEQFQSVRALAIRLTHGRWIVGASMGDGMLFRGEVTTPNTDEREALHLAESIAEDFSRLDWEDFERDQEEQLADC